MIAEGLPLGWEEKGWRAIQTGILPYYGFFFYYYILLSTFNRMTLTLTNSV